MITFPSLISFFYQLYCNVISLSDLKIVLPLCLLLLFAQQNGYLVRAINWMCGQPINLKLLICYSIYYNLISSNKPNKSKNHTNTFVICLCKNQILSLSWEKLVRQKPEQLDRFCQPCTGVPHVSRILWTGTVYFYINLQFEHWVNDNDIASSPCSLFNGFSHSTLPMIIMFQMKCYTWWVKSKQIIDSNLTSTVWKTNLVWIQRWLAKSQKSTASSHSVMAMLAWVISWC